MWLSLPSLSSNCFRQIRLKQRHYRYVEVKAVFTFDNDIRWQKENIRHSLIGRLNSPVGIPCFSVFVCFFRTNSHLNYAVIWCSCVFKNYSWSIGDVRYAKGTDISLIFPGFYVLWHYDSNVILLNVNRQFYLQ